MHTSEELCINPTASAYMIDFEDKAVKILSSGLRTVITSAVDVVTAGSQAIPAESSRLSAATLSEQQRVQRHPGMDRDISPLQPP